MLVSFLESFKYLGHLYPIAFLRVYLGYFYLESAIRKYNEGYLDQPIIVEMITQWLPSSNAPNWYQTIIEVLAVPNWIAFSTIFIAIEFIIGISFLIGYLVRPMSIIAIFIALNFMWFSSPDQATLFKALIAINVTLCWIGAGRCFGIDYYFYKRMRGWLW